MICNTRIEKAVKLLDENEHSEIIKLLEDFQEECYKQTNRANDNGTKATNLLIKETEYLKEIRELHNSGNKDFQTIANSLSSFIPDEWKDGESMLMTTLPIAKWDNAVNEDVPPIIIKLNKKQFDNIKYLSK